MRAPSLMRKVAEAADWTCDVGCSASVGGTGDKTSKAAVAAVAAAEGRRATDGQVQRVHRGGGRDERDKRVDGGDGKKAAIAEGCSRTPSGRREFESSARICGRNFKVVDVQSASVWTSACMTGLHISPMHYCCPHSPLLCPIAVCLVSFGYPRFDELTFRTLISLPGLNSCKCRVKGDNFTRVSSNSIRKKLPELARVPSRCSGSMQSHLSSTTLWLFRTERAISTAIKT